MSARLRNQIRCAGIVAQSTVEPEKTICVDTNGNGEPDVAVKSANGQYEVVESNTADYTVGSILSSVPSGTVVDCKCYKL